MRPPSRDARWARRLRWAHLVPLAAVLTVYYRVAARVRTPGELLGRSQPRRAPSRRPEPETVEGTVRRLQSFPPFRSECLVRSLVCARLLRLYGYPAAVVIGAPTGRPEQWIAHAWVELPGRPSGSPGHVELLRLSP